MNWPALGLAGVVVVLLMPSSKRLKKGRIYAATFRPPEGALLSPEMVANVQGILPPGSLVAVSDNGNLVVTFTVVNDREMTDFDTPIGKFRLLSVREV